MTRPLLWLLPLLVLAAAPARAERVEFVWPTPSKAWEKGRPISEFIQPTGSGDPESGTFGGVRSGGTQFHEGLDIKPVSRDRHGEPTDPVFAAMRGVVSYVCDRAGESNYGRYVVIEHPGVKPAVYTLYAHLARVEPGIRAGTQVNAGQVIGLMGHTSNGKGIPRERAHVHFEIGLRVSDNFDLWYRTKRYGSPNEHGNYNGMNLMGFDPLDFLRHWRAGRVADFQQYLAREPAAVRLRVGTSRVPDFITRYPSLLRRPMPMGLVSGWEVECNWTGIPFAWTPLTADQTVGLRPDSVQVLAVDESIVRAHRSKHLVRRVRGGYEPVGDLGEMLEQVFGFR